MLVIRLQRTGRKNLPAYRIVVAEKSKAVKKQTVEVVGHYLPTQNPKVLEVNQEKVLDWISKGAQPSDTAASLFKSLGMKDMDKYIDPRNKKRRKKNAPEEEEAPAAPAAEAPATEESDTPAEEPQVEEAAPAEEPTPEEAPAAEEPAAEETPAEEESTDAPAEEAKEEEPAAEEAPEADEAKEA